MGALSGSRHGFTLLEAVLALAILGLAATAALELAGGELRATQKYRHALEASALAEHKLETVRLFSVDEVERLHHSGLQGRFEAPFEDYRWRLTARPYLDAPELLEVEAEVSWRHGSLALGARMRHRWEALP